MTEQEYRLSEKIERILKETIKKIDQVGMDEGKSVCIVTDQIYRLKRRIEDMKDEREYHYNHLFPKLGE